MCVDDVASHADGVLGVAFSPDGAWIASSSSDKTIRLWDASSGALAATISPLPFAVRDMAFTADGKCLAAALGNQTLVWGVPSGSLAATMTIHYLTGIAVSADGKWLAGGAADKSVRLWRLPTGVPGAVLKGHTGWPSDLEFSPDGKWLVSAAEDHTVSLWNLSAGKLAVRLKGHTDGVTKVTFSSDGKWVASRSKDETVRLWEAPSGKAVATFSGHEASAKGVVFSPDGTWLATGSGDGTVRLREVPSGKVLTTLEVHEARLTDIAISPDGKLLASAYDDRIVRLWEVPAGKLAGQLVGHAGAIACVAFSPDGRRLASGSRDKSVRLWDIPSRELVNCFFDPAVLAQGKEVIQVKRTDAQGREIHSVVRCGSPMPPGAICTCNCVPGRFSVPSQPSGGSYCTCNKVCTCMAVPVCQAHKLLASDPVVRTLARQLVLSMGARELEYLEWAAATAPDERQRVAILLLIEEVARGTRPTPHDWPALEACLERLDSADEVVGILAAQGLAHVTEVERLPRGVRKRWTDMVRLAALRTSVVRREIAESRRRGETSTHVAMR